MVTTTLYEGQQKRHRCIEQSFGLCGEGGGGAMIWENGIKHDPWVGRILCRREWQPTPIFLPGESHVQRSPWAAVHGSHYYYYYDIANIIYTFSTIMQSKTSSEGCNITSKNLSDVNSFALSCHHGLEAAVLCHYFV